MSGLSLGTVAGQIILLIASPLLTRIYTPSEYGSYSAMLGFATLLATLCSLSYPITIPLARTQQEANDLFWMTFPAWLILAPPCTSLTAWVASRLGITSFSTTLWVAGAITALMIAVWGGQRAIASRADRFRSIALSGVADSGAQVGGQLALGQFAWGAIGLAGGYLAGKIAAVVVLLWGIRRQLTAPLRPVAAARRHARYTLLVTPTTLLNQASVTAVSPFIAGLYDAAAAGQFALAARMLAVPSALLGQAIAIVFFPKIARMTRDGLPTLPAVLSVASTLTSVALPIFGFTFLLGPEVFALVFGNEWREAGVAAAILSPWLALNLTSSPISSVATVRERLGQLLILGVFEASLRFGALALGSAAGNWYLSLALYAATGSVISIYTIAWVLRLSGGTMGGWMRSMPKASWAVMVAIGVLITLKPMMPSYPYVALSCALCGTGAMVAVRQLSHGLSRT